MYLTIQKNSLRFFYCLLCTLPNFPKFSPMIGNIFNRLASGSVDFKPVSPLLSIYFQGKAAENTFMSPDDL